MTGYVAVMSRSVRIASDLITLITSDLIASDLIVIDIIVTS